MEPPKETTWERITNDFKEKELLKIKLLFFVHSSSQYIIYPYLTVFYEDLGINTDEIGIISFFISVIGISFPPIVGMISDRIGNFRKLVCLIMIMGGFIAFVLLLVPKARIITYYPEKLTVSVECVHDGLFSFTISDGELCYKLQKKENLSQNDPIDASKRRSTLSENLNVTVDVCGLMCTDNSNSIPKQGAFLSQVNGYVINLTSTDQNNLSRQLAITGRDFSQTWSAKEGKEKIFNTSVQAFSSSLYFFPTPGFFKFECDGDVCSIKNAEESTNASLERTIRFHSLIPMMINNSVIKLTNFRDENEKLRCDQKTWNKASVMAYLDPANHASIGSYLRLTQCQPQCLARVGRANQCNETSVRQAINVPLSLYSLVAGRVALAAVSSTSMAMVDGAVISVLRVKNAEYGLQNVYATIGGMLSGQISGLLIDFFSTESQPNYRPAFFFYAFVKFLSAVIVWNIDLKMKSPTKRVFKDVLDVLKNLEAISLLIVCFLYGIGYGVIETYLFPYLRGLDASSGLLGSTILVGKLSGIPFLIFSGPILKYFGHARVLFMGFIVYTIRFMGYSIITNPWHCLVFEVMESLCVSLVTTALVTYAAKLSTSKTDTTIQGLIGGLYYGIGRGVGSLISGFLIENLHYRKTFRVFGVLTLIFSITYFLFYQFCIISRITVEAKEERPTIIRMDSKGEVNPAFTTNEFPVCEEQT